MVFSSSTVINAVMDAADSSDAVVAGAHPAMTSRAKSNGAKYDLAVNLDLFIFTSSFILFYSGTTVG